jgi:transposase
LADKGEETARVGELDGSEDRVDRVVHLFVPAQVLQHLGAHELRARAVKAWRGIATRYDKSPESYLAGLHLRASMIWINDLLKATG